MKCCFYLGIAANLFWLEALKKAGHKSASELEEFIYFIQGTIEKVDSIQDTIDLNTLSFTSILKIGFEVEEDLANELDNICDVKTGIPVFKIINLLINNNKIFDEKEKVIFENTLGYIDNKKRLSSQEMANELRLSIEKVKKIQKALFSSFERNFKFLTYYKLQETDLYSLDFSMHVLKLTGKFLLNLEKSSVRYNRFFIYRILLLFINDKYFLIGNENKAILHLHSKKFHNWNSTYLVSKELHTAFNLEEMVLELNLRIAGPVFHEYSISIYEFIFRFLIDKNVDLTFDMLAAIESILVSEFNIVFDEGKNIIIRKNKEKPMSKYVIEALEILGKPSSLLDIFNKVYEIYPNCNFSKNRIKTSIYNTKRIVYFGNKTFGIVDWKKNETGHPA